MTDQQTTHSEVTTRKALQVPHGINPDFATAAFWRTAIWCLACDFRSRQCDLIRSQMLQDQSGAIQKIFLHMTFPGESLASFVEHLGSRIKSLEGQAPAMPIVIGLSNGDKGLIRIENYQVSFDPEASLEEFSGLETLSYGNTSHERRVVSSWDDRVWCHVAGLL